MEQKNDNFSMQDIMRVANSPAGQRLLALLQQSDDPRLAQAMACASAGDYHQAGQVLSGLTASEEVRQLLQQLRG